MNMLTFFQLYNSEESCKSLFVDARLKAGVICRRCNSTDHYWLKSKERFRCKSCRYETTLRSGTALQYSKLPYRYWCYAVVILASRNATVSTLEIQRMLGHKHYLPIWSLVQKLQVCMGLCLQRRQSVRVTGFADGFVSAVAMASESQKPGISQVPVRAKSALHESDITRQRKKQQSYRGSIYLEAMGLKLQWPGRSLYHPRVLRASETQNHSTGSSAPADIPHNSCQAFEPVMKKQPRLRLAIYAAKSKLENAHHYVSTRYLQNYLSAYCFMNSYIHHTENQLDELLNILLMDKTS